MRKLGLKNREAAILFAVTRSRKAASADGERTIRPRIDHEPGQRSIISSKGFASGPLTAALPIAILRSPTDLVLTQRALSGLSVPELLDRSKRHGALISSESQADADFTMEAVATSTHLC